MQPCVQMFTRTRGSNPATVGRQRVDLLPCHSERERSLPQHTLTIMDLTNVSGLPAVSHTADRTRVVTILNLSPEPLVAIAKCNGKTVT